MKAFVTLVDPRTAMSTGRDYPSLEAALAVADEADDTCFVVVETADGAVVRDTRPKEWLDALDPEEIHH